jgi:hypothetical protein
MATVLLKQLDDELFRKLSEMARIRNTSIEDQIIAFLRTGLEQRASGLRDRAELIAAMTPKGVPQTDSTLLIREDRDR